LGHGSGNYSVTDSHLRETKKQAQDSDGRVYWTAAWISSATDPKVLQPPTAESSLHHNKCYHFPHAPDSSSFPTDANIDATYNRTPFEPICWFSVDKPNPTLYN